MNNAAAAAAITVLEIAQTCSPASDFMNLSLRQESSMLWSLGYEICVQEGEGMAQRLFGALKYG